MNGLEPHRWTVRISGQGRGSASVFARTHQMVVGPPLSFDPAEPQMTALEVLLGALGAELVNGFRLEAQRQRLSVDQVEGLVEGELEAPLVALGVVGSTGRPRLKRAAVKVYVSSSEPPERLRAVWDALVDRSPVVCTLRPTVQ